MKPFKPVEGIYENVDHKTFKRHDLRRIAACLREEANKLHALEARVSFIIWFDDDSSKIRDSPEVFADIEKPMKAVWMTLRSQDDAHFVELRLNTTSEARSDSLLTINGPDLDWVFAVQGKLRDILNGLDNKTELVYRPPGWLEFIALLFNLFVVILFSYSLFLFFNSVLRMPQIFSIVLFVVIVQLSLYVVPALTTNRFRTFLAELRPRIELVAVKTRMERQKKSTRWAVAKILVLPACISLLVAFLSSKLFD
jgi:hypothetical protein